MFDQTILSIIAIVNIFMLGFSTFNLFKRKSITNLLAAFCILSLVVLEIAKFSFFFEVPFADKIFGLGFCLISLFWLIFSVSLLPSKRYVFNRLILTPVLGLISLMFFLLWWIKPFIILPGNDLFPTLPQLAQYFFIFLIFDLSFSISNIERSLYFLRQKRLGLLFTSALFLLTPYVVLATYAVLFFEIHIGVLTYSSISVFAGGLIFLFASQKGFSIEAVKEKTVIHASLTLFLVGGYLFFIGAFIKLFQTFGWNLNVLFSFLTALFIFFALLFLIFSLSFRERLRTFLLRYLTRQKYDWQKIWEDFTYKISLVTDVEKIKKNIQDAISKIMNVSAVRVFVFEKETPFEEGFCDRLLRQGEAFNFNETFNSSSPDKNKFPKAKVFFKENKIEAAMPLYGDKEIIGLIGMSLNDNNFLDKELLKVLSLQASSVILNCWAYQKLREAEKKESIYKLSSFVIHDVKNYVNSLSLLVSNKDKFNNPEFREDAFFTLENAIGKMKRLINEFKTLRGDLAINKEKHKLSYLINEALRDLGKDRFKNTRLTIDVEESIEICVDRRYMNKVILNLLINALEAMPGEGNLIISTGIYTGQPGIDSKSGRNFAEIRFKDTGTGMSKDFIENELFKAFSSTKEKGMGVGLYQCKTIIEAHGGEIEAESVEGEGTVFKVRLPQV
ncbi:MAG: hypothetical protein KAS99_04120 [Candidatus Omnitrophica bacterium]|nr:hypothetical protein [Candidatus Omnitrophota bacterium]